MAMTGQWKSRYNVLAVLAIGMVVSNVDKAAMSVAIPYIAVDLHLTATEMGLVMSVFFASYAIAQIPGGLLARRFGVRKVASIALIWWSTFTGLTGAATNLVQLMAARFVFGLGEGVFPPCCFATIATWFPRRERATANAIMFSCSLLGGALAPLVVVAILTHVGWRAVFYALLVPGLVIAILFWKFVADRPSASKSISADELADIEQSRLDEGGIPEGKVGLGTILTRPGVIRYFLIYFTFDLSYWGWSAWLPTYLLKARGFSMIEMGILASIPFFVGTLGCILGGWMSDRYFSRSRRAPIVVAQLLGAVFLYLVFTAESTPALIAYQIIGGFFMMLFFGVFWALPMTTVPPELMGVTSGFIHMAGQVAAFVAPAFIGFLLDRSAGGFGSTFAFMICCLVVSALLVATMSNRARQSAA